MKKGIFLPVLACIMFWLLIFVAIARADNSARVNELQNEAKSLIEKRQQYTQALTQIDARLLEIQGGIKELQLQDKKDEAKPS